MRDPKEMTAAQRVDEIASIMALGILRLIMRKARKSNSFGEGLVDSSAKESVHADKLAEVVNYEDAVHSRANRSAARHAHRRIKR
jgi:hypothetical protein